MGAEREQQSDGIGNSKTILRSPISRDSTLQHFKELKELVDGANCYG